jgi:DNA-binding response OmpR family regulator
MSRILVIDDDEQFGRPIGRLVLREGHEHRTVENFRKGAEILSTYVPDLVIVELQPHWIVELGR